MMGIKIKDILIDNLKVGLITPFKTALRQVNYIDDVVVKVVLENNKIGYGEAPPTVAITNEDKNSIIVNIQKIKLLLINKSIFDEYIFEILDNNLKTSTSAKAAIEMAILDLQSQLNNQPLFKFLGGKDYKTLSTDLTISVNDILTMQKDAIDANKKGFNCLKIKVGIDTNKDLERILAINDVINKKTTLRIDANQAWNFKQSVEFLELLKKHQIPIEFVEQPLPKNQLKEMAKLTQLKLFDIVADESLFSLDDAKKILDLNSADILNIKLMKTGGIKEALKICKLAKKYNKQCMMGSMLESIISITSAVHLSFACDNIKYFDLDGPLLAKYIPNIGGAIYNKDSITLNKSSVGLGIKDI